MLSTIIQQIIVQIKGGNYQQALRIIEKQLRKQDATQLLLQLKAEALRKIGSDSESAETYKNAAGLAGENTAICWYNAGVQYQKISQISKAVNAYKNAIEVDSGHHPSRNNLCVLLYNQSRSEEALQHAKWLNLHSKNAEHLVNAGYVLRGSGCYDEADITFKHALALEPNNWKMVSAALQSAQYVCDWPTLDQLKSRYQDEIYKSENYELSKELHHVQIAWCDDEQTNFNMAIAATRRVLGEINSKYDHTNHKFGNKLRIGYVSSDFFNHATLHLLIGVLELHDKEAFEVFAYCHSHDDNSAYRKRFLKTVDHFNDISKLTDDQAAELIYSHQVDILIDLKGFTDKHRLKIFAQRPAPIQVTYIGFPGTSGAKFYDYAITDKLVTPDSSKPFYSEKLCRLPDTYQCNDNKRAIAENLIERKDYGLPEDSFVFCCFNQSYKIEETLFKAWIEILKRVNNSVLWILDLGEYALNRLQGHLESAGLNPNRIIVADKVTPPIHLKRLESFADLALDTRIVNGHTTTSDALWAGVPVVTLYGKHFNSRVSASLLSAVGLQELITHSVAEYIEKAVQLATNEGELRRIKEKLRVNRFREPLFDTERFTRHYELAFKLMAQNYTKNIVDHIDVPCLPPRERPFMEKMNTVLIDLKSLKKKENPDQVAAYFNLNQDCPVCNESKNRVIRRTTIGLSIEDREHEFSSDWAMCVGCGHVFRKRSLNNAGRLKVIDDLSQGALDRLQSHKIIDDCHKLLKADAQSSQIKILSVYPDERCFFATGLEFGYSMSAVVYQEHLEAFKKIGQSVIATNFMKMNITGTPDIIYFGRSLERSVSPKSMIQRARNILDKSGLVAVLFSNHSSLEWIDINANNRCATWNAPNVNQIFNRKGMQALFADVGFDLCSCKPVADNEAGVLMVFRLQQESH